MENGTLTWKLGDQITDRHDSEAFVVKHIPLMSTDWLSLGGRAVVKDCIRKLQDENPLEWTCGDLLSLLSQQNVMSIFDEIPRYCAGDKDLVDYLAEETRDMLVANVMADITPLVVMLKRLEEARLLEEEALDSSKNLPRRRI